MSGDGWTWSRERLNPSAKDIQKMIDNDDVMSVWTFQQCGCRIEVRPSDLPLDGVMCEHGHYVVGARHDGQLRGNVIIGGDS